jgi:hypothetical protein
MPDLEPGQRAIPPMQVPTITIIPAFFGNIAVDGKGNYRLTGTGHTGKYGFSAAAAVPTFTGDLAIMKVAQYDSRAGRFLLLYQSLAYECGLEGRQTTPQTIAKPTPTRLGTLADYNGHYEGTYLCRGIVGKMLLDLKASASGTLVAVYRSDNGDGEAYSMVGKWTPKGFILNPNEWINQPKPTYDMIGLDGAPTSKGLAGRLINPVCTTFEISRK